MLSVSAASLFHRLTQWSTSGAVGNLILSNGTYSGTVKYDTGYTANVTVNEGAVWNLTANTSIGALVNNGTVNRNGYTLTTTSTSGSGTINETTGISALKPAPSTLTPELYNLAGQRVNGAAKGIIIKNGQKIVVR